MGNAVGGLRDGMAGVGLHQLGVRKGELTFSHLLSFLELAPLGVCSPADISELSRRWAVGGPGNGCAIVDGSGVSRLWAQNLRLTGRQVCAGFRRPCRSRRIHLVTQGQ